MKKSVKKSLPHLLKDRAVKKRKIKKRKKQLVKNNPLNYNICVFIVIFFVNRTDSGQDVV